MKKKVTLMSFLIAMVMVAGAGALFVSEISAQGTTYKIGDRGPGGGFVFYDKGNMSDGWRYLEAAPVDQSSRTPWGCTGTSIPDAKGTGIGTGKANTAAIINSCRESGIAAKVAADYRSGGKKDWFLPSKDELNLIYINLNKAGVGGFAGYGYWSSSEAIATNAWSQSFNSGTQFSYGKNNSLLVRAVRAF